MPSAKILTEKQAYVAALKDKIADAASVVVVSYKGLNVANDTKLRKELREAGVEYSVVKNTMLALAVKDTSLEGLTEVLKGDTAVAVCQNDPIAAARILNEYAEKDKSKRFTLKAGSVNGQVMNSEEIKAIAKLPGLEGMLSMFAGAMTSTLAGLAVAMQAYVDKQEEPAA